MKTTTITLAVLALLSIGNVFGKDQLYKNVETNSEARTTTTIVCNGVGEKNLKPTKRYVVTSDINNYPIEKMIYLWSSESSTWEASQKYNYDYSIDGELLSLAFAEWDNVAASWSENVEYTMFPSNKSNTMNDFAIVSPYID